jgi:hypothetical protein
VGSFGRQRQETPQKLDKAFKQTRSQMSLLGYRWIPKSNIFAVTSMNKARLLDPRKDLPRRNQ